MFMSDMIFNRLMTPLCRCLEERISSCSTPSMRNRTRNEVSSGSRWMSLAPAWMPWVMSRLTNLTIGASSTTSLSLERSSVSSGASSSLDSSSRSSAAEYALSMAASMSDREEMTTRTFILVSELMSSRARTFPGSDIASTSRSSSIRSGRTWYLRQTWPGTLATTDPSKPVEVTSTNSSFACSASALTSTLSLT